MNKISISYSAPTERMRYGADILFGTCLGLEVEWVENVDLEIGQPLLYITHFDQVVKMSHPFIELLRRPYNAFFGCHVG